MPDNKKNNSKTSVAKKSGPSGLWIIALLVYFVFAFFLGLLIALYYPPIGALVFLLLLSVGYFFAPKPWRRFYALALVSLTIALVMLSGTWELMGSDASESMDTPTGVAFLAALLGLSLLVGGGIVAITVLLGTSFIVPWVISVGGNAGMDKGELRKFIIRSYLGVSPSYLVFAGSKIIAESPKGIMPQIGGPGLAIIKPETAVVFEHLGTVSRITGPTTLKDIKMFELPKAIIDLCPQWDTTGDFAVSTQDGEVVQLSVRYRSAIKRATSPARGDPSQERPPTLDNRAQDGSDSPTTKSDETAETLTGAPTVSEEIPPTFQNGSQEGPDSSTAPAASALETLPGAPDIDTTTIRNMAYNCGPKGWKEETRATVRSAVRAVVQGFVLDELFPALQRAEVKHDDAFAPALELARTQATAVTSTWGVLVDNLTIDRITPPAAVTEGTRVLRKSRIDAANATLAGQTEATVYDGLQRIEAISQATKLRILISQVTSVANELSPEHVAAYFDLLEKLAKIINSNRAVDYRYVEALEALSNNPNARIIIQPGNNGLFIENVMD